MENLQFMMGDINVPWPPGQRTGMDIKRPWVNWHKYRCRKMRKYVTTDINGDERWWTHR